MKLQPAHDLPIVPDKTNKRETTSHIFYLLQNGKLKDAIDKVNAVKVEEPYLFHSGMLEQIGFAILLESQKSNSVEDIITSLYGIAISQDERLIPLVHKALMYDDPHIQLTALSVLASFETDLTESLLLEAMRSNYLFVRLEAAYILASKKSPDANAQIEALMHKIDPQFKPLFPRLFAMLGSSELKRLLFDTDVEVRTEAILAAKDLRLDNLLPEIRKLATDPAPASLEACCLFFGDFHDLESIPTLEHIAKQNVPASLAAHYALYQLGKEGELEEIFKLAKQGNLFAIRLLGKLPGSLPLLQACSKSSDVNVRVNATIALLEQKNSAALEGLDTILITSHEDYTFLPIYSLSKGFTAWKVVSSSEQNVQDPSFFELSLSLREEILTRASELAEEDFLYIAELLFAYSQRDLIPRCVHLLQNIRTEKCIALLRKEEQKIGAPFVRAWCRLALFRLHEEGPYADGIRAIVEKHENQDAFALRPVLPWRMRENDRYVLTLDESCRLLIECYQALAAAQDEKGIELLLNSIRNGNVHNRYVLAGLLMRSSI